MLDSSAIGKKIHELRVISNYSQDQIAEILYVTRQAVSRWELGQTLPSIDNLIELSKLFNVSFEEILCMNDEAVIDNNNIFAGHNRAFIVKSIINGKIEVDLAKVFYQFSDEERMQILSALKSKKLQTNIKCLKVRLTPTELDYLLGGEN
ncbi:MAG: helix-turn-helix transcriptional regulator [Bacilli bacterium]|nr:helix-turn-helix transcriptional regulator [Bacilli bacterium]MDD4584833.1 helix-turn-helix transcriptional regulator [Bacilli bacterium]